MYDSHIFCEEYKNLKDLIAGIYNGEVYDSDMESISDYIQELYDNGEMSSSQYDELMGYITDWQ